MAYKRLTIKEIATLAGVSPSTVSFVINRRDGIKEETREKVLAVIEENDYHPNAASQRMKLNKSFNIALIYPEVASPFTDMFYTEVANGIVGELTKNRYNVVLTPVEQSQYSYELPYIIKRQDADGAIFLQQIPDMFLDEFDELNIPYVLVDWQATHNTRTCVKLDNEQASARAVGYLAGKGHKQIAFWGSDDYPYYYLQCFHGYQNALTEAQLPIYPGWISNTVYDLNGAVEAMKAIASMPVRPTAICCMRDMCAVSAVQAAALCGIRIPEDVSLISIDDILLSRYIYPSLTTVSYDKNAIGKIAANLLLEKIAGEAPKSIVVACSGIVERQSVKDLSEE